MEFVASCRARRHGNRQRIRRDKRRDQPPPELCTQGRDDQRCPVGRDEILRERGTAQVRSRLCHRTVASGKNGNEIASRDTKFGIGFIETGTGSDARVFLERR